MSAPAGDLPAAHRTRHVPSSTFTPTMRLMALPPLPQVRPLSGRFAARGRWPRAKRGRHACPARLSAGHGPHGEPLTVRGFTCPQFGAVRWPVPGRCGAVRKVVGAGVPSLFKIFSLMPGQWGRSSSVYVPGGGLGTPSGSRSELVGVVEGGVQAVGVVPADSLDDGAFDLVSVSPGPLVLDQFGFEGAVEGLGHGVDSRSCRRRSRSTRSRRPRSGARRSEWTRIGRRGRCDE